MPLNDDGWSKYVQVWFVKGYPNYGYPTKLAAEAAASTMHPNRDTNSMVFYMFAAFSEVDSNALS
jgi:hypothetical protein